MRLVVVWRMAVLGLCLGSGLPTLLSAEGEFGLQETITNAANGAQSVFPADLDGDGDADVLSASYWDDKIAWYENINGLGAFGPQQVISAAAIGACSVFAADLDGDGDADVLSASCDDHKIAWYDNSNGLGTFGPQKVISTSAIGAFSVFAMDLDGDGDTDVLSASYWDDKIAWYKNTNGLGTFGPQQVISTAADGASSVFATDVDGDGDTDALSASYWDDKIAWYENTNGLGAFGLQQVISAAANGARCVFATDVDGDGDSDVLSASYYDDKVAWYPNTNGLGAFGAQKVTSTAADAATSVFATDVDGDGDADVLSASSNDDKIAWYENADGLGTFGAQQVISTTADGAMSVFGVDLEGDGDTDVLSGSYYDDKIAWYPNDPSGADGFGPQQVISAAANGAWCVFATDVDGDEDMDVLSASFWDDKIAWYENTNGLGTFGPQQVISTAADGASSVLATDVDGDGDMDVLSASYCDNKVAWYENTNGLGSFGLPQLISTAANGAQCVFATDLDGDGDVDVLSASENDHKVAWYENTNGLGSFGSPQLISTAANGARCVFATDLDGDGDADVLSASTYDNKVAWYENTNGLGSFGSPQLISTAYWPLCVFAADVDGDGDTDALSGGGDVIAWYENTNGLGAFGPQQVIPGGGSLSVFATDLEGDGDMDVVSSSYISIGWYENTHGLGLFGNHVISTAVIEPCSVFVSDLDGDGDGDVLSASIGDNKIAWYESFMGACQADMGHQGPGNVTVKVCGQPLFSGQTGDFFLRGALPNALTLLLVSPYFTPTYVWEAGGYLCPILPPLVLVILPVDSKGESNIPKGVPGGSGPASIYVQAVSQDACQPMGWCVSNCVRIDLLP